MLPFLWLQNIRGPPVIFRNPNVDEAAAATKSVDRRLRIKQSRNDRLPMKSRRGIARQSASAHLAKSCRPPAIGPDCILELWRHEREQAAVIVKLHAEIALDVFGLKKRKCPI